jgi:hypothetical protein
MNPILKQRFIWLLFAVILGSGAFFVGCTRSDSTAQSKTLYTCGMHPQVIQDHPGNCPICGMKLTLIRKQIVGDASSANGERKIKYYKSTMNPGETSPQPGKDSMGMDMVSVYENEAAAANSSEIAVDPVTIQNMNIQTTAVIIKSPSTSPITGEANIGMTTLCHNPSILPVAAFVVDQRMTSHLPRAEARVAPHSAPISA